MKVYIGDYSDEEQGRREEIHIDSFDTWSMDSTLALVIVPMLKQLKDTKHGVPGGMPYMDQTSNSGQASFDFYADGDKAAFNAGSKKWDEIMEKMIFAFEHILDNDWEEGFSTGVIEWDEIPQYDANGNIYAYELVEGKAHTRQTDYAGIDTVKAKIQEGLELFGKHYQSLWD